MSKIKTTVIINPASGAGKTRTHLDKYTGILKEKLLNPEILVTQKSGEAAALARSALKNKTNHIIGVGGDGTIHEIVNGFFDKGKPLQSGAKLSIISVGTGGDFIRSIDPKRSGLDFSEQLDIILRNKPQKIDVGLYACRIKNPPEAAPQTPVESTGCFINAVNFGLGALVVERINRYSFLKILGGRFVFYAATLLSMAGYKNMKITFHEGKKTYTCKIRNAVISNGRFVGGGMMVAPNAFYNDGLFDVILMKDLGFFDSLFLTGKIYKGRHMEHPLIDGLQTKKLNCESEHEIWVEADGEVKGILPAKFEILPKALWFQ